MGKGKEDGKENEMKEREETGERTRYQPLDEGHFLFSKSVLFLPSSA